MPHSQWSKIEEVFQAALDVPTAERCAWLDERCGVDASLRAEVESLLAAEEASADFLPKSEFGRAVCELLAEAEEGREGQRVGPYKLLREIGRGGMGVVYLAEREDERFRQQVAIKVVKRGLDTEDILRRFRQERQILASLHHPNIAQLFDGGETEDGLPFFVMEYIEGRPLLQYCDARGLSVSERLRLFRRVCAAVAYAHQSLVVHRDLKPSNILVTPDGEPKLLDFGVAKLLSPGSAAAGLTETQGVRVMTPEYASPEQVRGQHITTATDVYSLGIILYELLTGGHPYRLKDASPEELSRVICDSEPSKPSDAASVVQTGDGRATGEVGRRTKLQPAPRNLKSLRGDLDNIVLKALRKEPERRYKSVEQFSEDIKRHLEGLPVIARPDTLAYRASKFIRRHRAGVVAAALVFVFLVGGIIATLWQAQAARREQVKAEEIKNFLEETLTYSDPRVAGRNGQQTTIAEAVDEAAGRLRRGEFSQQPEVKAELEHIISQSYYGQGKYQPAREHLQEYVSLTRQLYGERHPKALTALSNWAALLFQHNEMAEAENIYRRVLPPMRDEQRKGNIKATSLAEALNSFGYLRRTQGDSGEAESLFREALALSPQMSPEEWRYTDGTTRGTLASVLADQGRFDEALQTAREAVEECVRQGGTNTPNLGFALTILGGFLAERSDHAEADADLTEAEAIFRRQLAPSSLWLGDNLRNQAYSLYLQGKYPTALDKVNETLHIYTESFGTHYDHYPTALIIQGLTLTKTGRAKEGERILREALKMRIDSLPQGHFWIALAQSALGESLTIQRRYKEAEPLLRESYESLNNSQGANNPRTRLAARRVAALYESWGRATRQPNTRQTNRRHATSPSAQPTARLGGRAANANDRRR